MNHKKINYVIDMTKDMDIENLIYTIRGKQVMIDSDVANIYHCETKYVNRVVKRNIEQFLEEFCFQLNENESESFKVPICHLKRKWKRTT